MQTKVGQIKAFAAAGNVHMISFGFENLYIIIT